MVLKTYLQLGPNLEDDDSVRWHDTLGEGNGPKGILKQFSEVFSFQTCTNVVGSPSAWNEALSFFLSHTQGCQSLCSSWSQTTSSRVISYFELKMTNREFRQKTCAKYEVGRTSKGRSE